MPNRRRVAITGFGAFLLGVLFFVVFFYFNFRTVEVHGQSMLTTFQPGQRLLMSSAYWLVGDVRFNDIVVLKEPESGDVIIKRVKGMPGDVIDLIDVPHNWKLSNGEFRVEPGKIYVLGDNKMVSQDSRDFGAVDRSEILGKVVIFGNETWLYGILGIAVTSIAAAGVAAILDSRGKTREAS